MVPQIIAHIDARRNNPEWLVSVAGLEAETFSAFLEFVYEGEASKQDICASAFGQEAWKVAENAVYEEISRGEKTDRKLERTKAKLVNRGLWSPVVHMQAFARESGKLEGKVRWYAKHDLDAPGLFVRTLEWHGVELNAPVVMNVENLLPNYIKDNGKEGPQYEIPKSEIENFWKQGWLYSGGKTIWNVNEKTQIGAKVKEWMSSIFSTDIDCSSYNRRFRAPLIKDGFIPNIRVQTSTQFAYKDGVPMVQGCDGSGLYDPFHPDVADVVERYGIVTLQLTAFEPVSGTMWKGTVVPRAGINQNLPDEQKAAIHFDHLQVKGKMKSFHKGLHKQVAARPEHQLHEDHKTEVDEKGKPVIVYNTSKVFAEALEAVNNNVVMHDGVFVGLMKAKVRPGKVSSCFELIEQLGAQFENGDIDTYLRGSRTIKRIIVKYVTQEMERLKELGPNGLLGRATRDDPKLKRLAMFINTANKKLKDMNARQVSPLDVPMLEGKLESSMRQALWTPANGGGITGKYPFAIIDNTLEPGTCVMSGYKVGEELAVWRFPTVLAQGLTTLKVVTPSAHHETHSEGGEVRKSKRIEKYCVATKKWIPTTDKSKKSKKNTEYWDNGNKYRVVTEEYVAYNTVPNVLFMNEQDIVTRMQGDDDGDEIGVSNDPDLVELFKLRRDMNIYHIEPASEKRSMKDKYGNIVPVPVWCQKGRDYIGVDQTGPVGIVTIWKAGLDAVGAHDASTAFAVGVQEAIDSQKNIVRFTNPNRARYLKNWHKDESGEYHIHHKGENGEWETENFLSDKAEDEFPLEVYEAMYANTLIEHGCYRTKIIDGETKRVAGNPLGWRSQKRIRPDGSEEKLKKAIAFRNFELAGNKQDGNHGNWVHFAHDEVYRQWRGLESQWTSKRTIPARELMTEILSSAGIHMDTPVVDWSTYRNGLRERSGLNWYGEQMKKLLSKKKFEGNNEESQAAKTSRIDRIRDELDIRISDLTKEELYAIWMHELTSTWYYKVKGHTTYLNEKEAEVAKKEGHKVYQANNPNYAFTAAACGRSAIMKALGVKIKDRCMFLHDGEVDEKTGISTKALKVVNWCFTNGKYGNAFDSMIYLMKNEKGHTNSVVDTNGEPVALHECKDCCDDLSTLLVRHIRENRKVTETEGANALVSALNRMDQEKLHGWDRMVAVKSRIQKKSDKLQQMRHEDDCQENYV